MCVVMVLFKEGGNDDGCRWDVMVGICVWCEWWDWWGSCVVVV